jgi:SOS-response transcriptional repressor LexA
MDKKEIKRRALEVLVERAGGRNKGGINAVAAAIERDPSYVSRMLYPPGKSGARGIGEEVDEALGKAFPSWGRIKAELASTSSAVASPIADYIVTAKSAPPPVATGCPLLTYQKAAELITNPDVQSATEWLPCPVPHGAATFVLRLIGETMFNPGVAPSFREGEFIFIDPERVAAHGSFIVVRESTGNIIFRKLLVDGGRRYLEALNTSWPERIIEFPADAALCGVAIFKGEIL